MRSEFHLVQRDETTSIHDHRLTSYYGEILHGRMDFMSHDIFSHLLVVGMQLALASKVPLRESVAKQVHLIVQILL